MPIARLSEVELHYEEAGHGPALVLLHGLGHDGRLWAPQAIPLMRRFRVVVPDLRGHGKSAAPAAGYGFSDYAEDVLELCEKLGIASAHFCGHDLGAGVALELALAAPERVRSLTLLSPEVSGWQWSPAWRQLWRQVLAARRARGAGDAVREVWLDAELHAGARERFEARALLDVMAADFSGVPLDGCPVTGFAPAGGDDPGAIAHLSRVRVPVAIALGDADHEDVRAIADHLALGIPGAVLHRFEGAGHALNLELPAQVADLVATHALAAERTHVGVVA